MSPTSKNELDTEQEIQTLTEQKPDQSIENLDNLPEFELEEDVNIVDLDEELDLSEQEEEIPEEPSADDELLDVPADFEFELEEDGEDSVTVVDIEADVDELIPEINLSDIDKEDLAIIDALTNESALNEDDVVAEVPEDDLLEDEISEELLPQDASLAPSELDDDFETLVNNSGFDKTLEPDIKPFAQSDITLPEIEEPALSKLDDSHYELDEIQLDETQLGEVDNAEIESDELSVEPIAEEVLVAESPVEEAQLEEPTDDTVALETPEPESLSADDINTDLATESLGSLSEPEDDTSIAELDIEPATDLTDDFVNVATSQIDFDEETLPSIDFEESAEYFEEAISNIQLGPDVSAPLQESVDTFTEQVAKLTAQISQLGEQLADLKSSAAQPSQPEQSAETMPTELKQSPAKQFSTGIYYAKNEDYINAAKWFRKASMQGHGKAMFYLGMMFVKGQGLPKSEFHSLIWMTLAQCWGVMEAMAAKKELEKRLNSQDINQAHRIAADRFEQIHELNNQH